LIKSSPNGNEHPASSTNRPLTVVHQEHFNAKDTSTFQGRHGFLSKLPCALIQTDHSGSSDPQRRLANPQDALSVDGLNSIVRPNFAFLVANNHDCHLLFEVGPLLGVQRPVGTEVLERGGNVTGVGGFQRRVATAIVRKSTALQHHRHTNLGSQLLHILLRRVRGDSFEWRDGKSAILQVLLLQVLVLDQADSTRARLNFAKSLFLNSFEYIGVDVLNLHCQDITVLGQLANMGL
jgi:hypothetical protein